MDVFENWVNTNYKLSSDAFWKLPLSNRLMLFNNFVSYNTDFALQYDFTSVYWKTWAINHFGISSSSKEFDWTTPRRRRGMFARQACVHYNARQSFYKLRCSNPSYDTWFDIYINSKGYLYPYLIDCDYSGFAQSFRRCYKHTDLGVEIMKHLHECYSVFVERMSEYSYSPMNFETFFYIFYPRYTSFLAEANPRQLLRGLELYAIYLHDFAKDNAYSWFRCTEYTAKKGLISHYLYNKFNFWDF